MTTYNTGNPVGSSDPRDLYDNAENLDSLVNGAQPAYDDRLGQARKSWTGMESEFNADQADRAAQFAAFIAASGYEFVGDYAAGIDLTGYQQILRDTAGEFWRLSGYVTLPYTTTGTGLPEGGNFVAVGDAALRQELAMPVSGGNGAMHVSGATIYVESVAELEGLPSPRDGQQAVVHGASFVFDGAASQWIAETPVSVKSFGAIGDGVADDGPAIQAAIDYAGAGRGGEVWFPAGIYRITTTLNAKTAVKLSGIFGEFEIPGQTADTGSKILWDGVNGGTILSVFAVRFFTLDGLFLDGGGKTGVTGILLDTDNIPAGAQNTFERFMILNCFIGVQWGTSGIAGGSKQNNGTIFRQFKIRSLNEVGSKGFVLNSGNSAQYSTIENGGIEVEDTAVDVIVTNQLQLRRVVSGYKCKNAFCQISIGINILIEGCESENMGSRIDGKISEDSDFIKVVPPAEPYPVFNTTIVLIQNTINNPITVTYPVRIVSTGDAWGSCWSTSDTVVPVTGVFTSGVSSCLALGNGVTPGGGWQPSQFVALQNLHPEPTEFQKDVITQPGFYQFIQPGTQVAADNLKRAVDSTGYGGKLWTEHTTSANSSFGAGKNVWEVNGTKAVLTLDESEVVVGQPGSSTRLRFAQLEDIVSSADAGETGQMIASGNYIFVCVAPNTWKCAALTTF